MPSRIHIIAPAGPCTKFIATLGVSSAEELLDVIQKACGESFTVTGDTDLFTAKEDELAGGRTDDAARAKDIETALADDDVAALVTLRGGAWFTRILPRIDFSVLDRRRRPVAVWGFSELTTLVNIVAAHARGLGVYDMGPAFLAYGLRRHAEQHRGASLPDGVSPKEWAAQMLRPQFTAFFERVVAALSGSSSGIVIDATLVRGRIDECPTQAVFVGGNLTVLSTLIGSRYDACIAPTDRWLMIEDFNDKPERMDRFLSHLTLAGYFERCAGVLLGDFHFQDRDLIPAVLAMLDFHLPGVRRVPVLTTRTVGHAWPMTPLPLHVSATLSFDDTGGCRIAFPPDAHTLCPQR